ncbi:MAG: EAL domain-containing protein [Pseudomonadales bacterium]|jgi:diguanylate cyclase (GGDEF)-like protein/PAS domain S-box-containing protein|nr:EAL domain-containing protein [Pseudomonadales bacterium]
MTPDLDAGFASLVEGLQALARLPSLESTSTASVLVVDDRSSYIDSLVRLIEVGGDYVVRSAAGGVEALAEIERSVPDIMLLDLVMPDMTGHEVIDSVVDAGHDVRIIVVSGEPSFEHVQRALTRGAVDFVRKPYEPAELLSTLERVRDRLRLERRARAMERRLEYSEQLHRFVVDASPDIFYMLDARGRFAFLNQRVETLLGIPRDELIGRSYTALIPEDQQELARYAFAERRTGERASRDVEIFLHSRQLGGAAGETGRAPVELTAVGIYAGEGETRRRIGTWGVVRDIADRKRALETIEFQAWHDALTHLPNRALFTDRLELALAQAGRGDRRLAVMFLDLDRFKVVNDTLGHTTGDRLLRQVATRLKSCIRRGDTLARFGGDEFCLLLADVGSMSDVERIACKILDRLAASFIVDDHELFVGASIGIAPYPETGDTAEALIRAADIAVHHVKERGKNAFRFYDARMGEIVSAQLSTERELRTALLADQLEPHYQPQVDVQSGRVLGVEALARWQHPQRGEIGPAAFIPLAEETGLIVAIDQCVQRKACEDVARWRREGHAELALSLNISAAQIEAEEFVDWMLTMLRETGVGTEGIKLEITESVIMREMDVIVPKLSKLSAHGLTIGIDDFGTGYSSLSYLQHFPVHTLKIDRAFVSDIRDDDTEASIVNAIIHMAKGLGLDIIAEGVENEAQLRYLRDRGCQLVQGFIFSRPLAREELGRYLAASAEAGDAIRDLHGRTLVAG